jgi:MFS family permease
MFRAFRHRNYRLFFGGQLISVCGTWMQTVAQSWLIYRLTGSALLLGLVGFASQFPVFLLSPLGGAAADRHDRRRILVGTQSASMILALILAALTLSGLIRPWHLLILATLLGLVNAIDVPTRQSYMVEMVGKDDLINAIALNSSMFNSARIIGPAIAGVLVAAIGEGWCFFANALSYIAVITGLLFIHTAKPEKARSGTVLAGIVEGFRFVWSARSMRAALLLLGVVSLTGISYAVLMPIFVDRILHGGPRALGMLMSSAGAGALLGALALAARRGVLGLERWIAFCAVCFGLCLALFSQSQSFRLSCALLVPTGFFMVGQMASTNTLIQTLSPDPLRGRVMAVYSMMLIGMAPFGSLLAGALAHRLGAPNTVALGGAVALAGGLVYAVRLRRRGPAKVEGLRCTA